MKYLAGAMIALSLMAGTALAGECAPNKTYENQMVGIKNADKALGIVSEVTEVGPGAGLDTLKALLAQPNYAGRELDFDSAIVLNNEKMQTALVGLFKDKCFVISGPISKADYFKLLPTIKGV